MENHAKIFGKLTLTFCFNSAFKTHPNEVNNFAIYIKEEIFVRVQFHKFPDLFTNVC